MSVADALPHNLEAEQALLGCLLFDNAVYERITDRLRPDHFYEPFHQRLFTAIEGQLRKGLLAEPTILSTAFGDDPAFTEFGGIRYLADLVDRAPPGANAADYARAIHDLALRRNLIRVAGDIGTAATDPDLTAQEHLECAESALYALADTGEQGQGVVAFSDAADGALAMIEAAFRRDGALSGLPTHLIDLDQKLGGLHPSDLLILAGRPSMGKTALATNIAFNVARSYKWVPDADAPHGRKTVAGGRVLFFSLEMSKEQLAQRILADVSGVSSDAMRKGVISAKEFADIREARDAIRAVPLDIDATGGLHLAKLAARARRQARRTGLDLIVVDYLQLITTDGSKSGNRTQEVTAITGGLKALAKELNVPILALSQLSRQVESRDDKRPMLSDLRESGSIEQDADCVMFVFRHEYYLSRSEPKPGTQAHVEWCDQMNDAVGKAEVIVGKQRHGPIGTVYLAFDDKTTRFGNLARESEQVAYRSPYGEA